MAVGRSDEVRIPADAFVLDVTGKTVLPGLIDAHAHGGMGQSEITPEQNWIQFSNLGFGVTTIHDPSNDTTEIFAAAEMQRAGQILRQVIYIIKSTKQPEAANIIECCTESASQQTRIP